MGGSACAMRQLRSTISGWDGRSVMHLFYLELCSPVLVVWKMSQSDILRFNLSISTLIRPICICVGTSWSCCVSSSIWEGAGDLGRLSSQSLDATDEASSIPSTASIAFTTNAHELQRNAWWSISDARLEHSAGKNNISNNTTTLTASHVFWSFAYVYFEIAQHGAGWGLFSPTNPDLANIWATRTLRILAFLYFLGFHLDFQVLKFPKTCPGPSMGRARPSGRPLGGPLSR